MYYEWNKVVGNPGNYQLVVTLLSFGNYYFFLLLYNNKSIKTFDLILNEIIYIYNI